MLPDCTLWTSRYRSYDLHALDTRCHNIISSAGVKLGSHQLAVARALFWAKNAMCAKNVIGWLFVSPFDASLRRDRHFSNTCFCRVRYVHEQRTTIIEESVKFRTRKRLAKIAFSSEIVVSITAPICRMPRVYWILFFVSQQILSLCEYELISTLRRVAHPYSSLQIPVVQLCL